MKNKTPGNRHTPGTTVVAAIGLFALLHGHAVADEDEPRESRTMQYDKGERAGTSAGPVSEDRYGPLVIEGDRVAPAKAQRNTKPAAGDTAHKGVSNDFWFFDADVVLFNDDDNDGYFHGIDVMFDVDTYYEFADVYVALYLSYEGGPWNEYAVTDTFRVFGATSDDEYVVVTELKSGYRRGHYDLLIELYDAVDGTFLAELGPADHPDFAFLPLEDFNRDTPRIDRGRGGGGALDLWTALMLVMSALAAWLVRRRQREHDRDRR